MEVKEKVLKKKKKAAKKAKKVRDSTHNCSAQLNSLVFSLIFIYYFQAAEEETVVVEEETPKVRIFCCAISLRFHKG